MITIKNTEKQFIHITPNCEDLIANRILKCPESNCSTTFTNLSNLQMHLSKHHKIIMEKPNRNSIDNDKIKLFFCPDADCIYNEKMLNKNENGNGKYFTSLKYVRQHYQKVHADKKFKCEKCNKSFITEGSLRKHHVNCGKKFQCNICGWEYNCKEALLTHAKRKSHNITTIINKNDNNSNSNSSNNNSSSIKENKIKILPYKHNNNSPIKAYFFRIIKEQEDKSIQTEFNSSTQFSSCNCNYMKQNSNGKRKLNFSTSQQQEQQDEMKYTKLSCKDNNKIHTEFISDYSSNDNVKKLQKSNLEFMFDEVNNLSHKEKDKKNLNSLISFNCDEDDTVNSCFEQLVDPSSFCHIETQTEFSLLTSSSTVTAATTTILDQMLYSNMHTQTCDDFLSELGLADIQTQTNWSTINESDDNVEENIINDITNGTVRRRGGGEGKEGTVRTTAATNASSTSGAHDELLVSTETQTSFTQCLLECNGSSTPSITQHTQTCETLLEGLFGGQENDFITNFQSTYTQT